MIVRAWCRMCSTALITSSGGAKCRRQLDASSWFSARDYVGGGEQQEGTRWLPKKRLTRYQMDYLRTLRAESPELWTLRRLSKYFGISYVSVVRILKSKFQPSEQVVERQDALAIKQREQRKQVLRKKILALRETDK